jgi:hypothetical protein
MEFPKMIEVRQTYPPSPRLNISQLLHEQFARTGVRKKVVPGMRIAVGVGSRGITNLNEIVKATIDLLIEAGAHPFLVPAMGSHGGATPEGQAEVLADYGITAESVGVPIETGMEVVKIGTALDGQDVVFSVPALNSDGVIAINRIKPHTDFRGPLGSGIQKMLTIGFGKQQGAANAHRAAAHLGHETVIREFSKVILERVPVLCGIAIVEDQHHQTAEIKVIGREAIASEESELLERSRALMPRLPLDEIDLLIVDQIGKEISGTGMDTNIIGRDISGYLATLRPDSLLSPRIFRIFVRDLTTATNGNGIGIGLADFTTSRAVKSLNMRYTYVNAVTSIGLQPAKIPIHFDSDRETIQAALATLASAKPETLRVMRVVNTLNLEHMLVSESCVGALMDKPGIKIIGPAKSMEFDESENLLPF